MSDSDFPAWHPPLAGTEAEHLIGALERQRATFRWKADGLDAAGLSVRIGASTLTLGRLLKHLTHAEDYMFTQKLRGEPLGDPWPADDWPSNDWVFTSADNDAPEALYSLYDGAVTRSRERLNAALADGGVDQLVHVSTPDGEHASLRRCGSAGGLATDGQAPSSAAGAKTMHLQRKFG